MARAGEVERLARGTSRRSAFPAASRSATPGTGAEKCSRTSRDLLRRAALAAMGPPPAYSCLKPGGHNIQGAFDLQAAEQSARDLGGAKEGRSLLLVRGAADGADVLLVSAPWPRGTARAQGALAPRLLGCCRPGVEFELLACTGGGRLVRARAAVARGDQRRSALRHQGRRPADGL